MDDSDLCDLDSLMDVDPAPPPPFSRPSRFLPKLKGKLKADPDPLPNQDPPPSLPFQQPDQNVGDVTMIEDDVELKKGEGGGEEEEDDSVIREIDVFITPLDGDAQLFVMQYPLRPHWRPYELENRCEVKLKPQSLEVEVVLSVDVESENHDQHVPETTRFHKQTLSSSKANSGVDCTAGFLIKNQLYLNPVHQVLQFRPSKDHLNDPGAQKGKHINQEVRTKSEKGKSVSGNLSDNIDSNEPWVSLQYNAIDSVWSCMYKEKLIEQKDYSINFTMNRSEYLDSLCPRTSATKRAAKVPSSRFLPSLSLEERLEEWLRKECQVNRFDALRHLDTEASEEDFLNMLQSHAVLVQGVWVSKSSLIYEGRDAKVRDYILSLFARSHVIKPNQLKPLNLREDHLKGLLKPLAYERNMKDWKFKEERDISFIKGHLQIVKRQEVAWSDREVDLSDLFRVGKARPMIAKNNPISNITKTKFDASNKISDGTGSSAATTISNEIRDSLQKALSEIFSDGNARSLNSIQRKLQELALSKFSRPKEDSRTKALVNFVSTTASGQTAELLSVLKNVTFQVHNVYVLRSGQNPVHDPLRKVIVTFFCGKEPNAKLKKQEIIEAAKAILERDIPTNEYNQVVKELCVYSKGAWVLKNADNLA